MSNHMTAILDLLCIVYSGIGRWSGYYISCFSWYKYLTIPSKTPGKELPPPPQIFPKTGPLWSSISGKNKKYML